MQKLNSLAKEIKTEQQNLRTENYHESRTLQQLQKITVPTPTKTQLPQIAGNTPEIVTERSDLQLRILREKLQKGQLRVKYDTSFKPQSSTNLYKNSQSKSVNDTQYRNILGAH